MTVINRKYKGPTFVTKVHTLCKHRRAVYTSLMIEETTLNELGTMMEYLIGYMSANMATKDDIAAVRNDMATKEQIFALQEQVNSIEGQLRGINHSKLVSRVSDLEEEVFGKARP